MICLMCKQAEPRPGLTTVTLERGELLLTIKHVPAQVCPSCGESYADEPTVHHLLLMAKQMEESGLLADICEYKSS
jgi:YgiT-type zinc finger domain-containing protein